MIDISVVRTDERKDLKDVVNNKNKLKYAFHLNFYYDFIFEK